MTRSKQEEVGTITVVDDAQNLKQVIISQDNISYYKRDNSHTKSLHLDTIDGPEVFKTNDPNIFTMQDGALLRKKSR